VESLVEDRLGDLDYAILRMTCNPGQAYGTARFGTADAPVGSTIAIIGHPRGVPKRVEAGPVSEYRDFKIYYNDIDTDRGNSESGILARPEGLLVGSHTNGRCTAQGSGNNDSVRISSLREVSPILRELATK
jgi:V8-like Glu-specific endopeptidase